MGSRVSLRLHLRTAAFTDNSLRLYPAARASNPHEGGLIMRRVNSLALGVLALVALLAPSAWSAVGDITVEMGGSPACTKTGTNSVNIAGACPPSGAAIITITPKNSSYNARVEIGQPDSSLDKLQLTNSIITANQAISGFHIIFKAHLQQGPNTTAARQWYRTWLNGLMSAGAGNQVKATGYVENPLGQTPPAERTMATAIYNNQN